MSGKYFGQEMDCSMVEFIGIDWTGGDDSFEMLS